MLISALMLAGCSGRADPPAPDPSAVGGTPSGPVGGTSSLVVRGAVGVPPEVGWVSRVDVTRSRTALLVPGPVDGDSLPLRAGDTAVAHLWVGNATTQVKAYSTYDRDRPSLLTLDRAQLNPALYQALAGRTAGSRVLVVAPPADAFGRLGSPEVGIGPSDDVVFVVDVLHKVMAGPSGPTRVPPPQAPRVEVRGGTPIGIDFRAAAPRPPRRLQVVPLVSGDGPAVRSGDETVLDYLGQVYGSDEAFDQSYTGQPFRTEIGTGAVIAGWDRALVGQRVGSRLLLVVPPALAYGRRGRDDVPPRATLVFVVDLLAAY